MEKPDEIGPLVNDFEGGNRGDSSKENYGCAGELFLGLGDEGGNKVFFGHGGDFSTKGLQIEF